MYTYITKKYQVIPKQIEETVKNSEYIVLGSKQEGFYIVVSNANSSLCNRIYALETNDLDGDIYDLK